MAVAKRDGYYAPTISKMNGDRDMVGLLLEEALR